MKGFFISFVLLLLAMPSLFSEDFITQKEYAKMLYSNPRGIGCNKCHGEKGEGSVIATYIQKGKEMALKAPAITQLSKARFFQAMNRQHNVMPTYFLTSQEINSLYYYVSNVNK
ncbi:MAG: cytochrome c [Sulfurospirillaceae bacterium]|nr:cytochrome c [Sulfurospirillaceae bacterium]